MGQVIGSSRQKKREKILESQRRVGAVPRKSQMYLAAIIAMGVSFLIVALIVSMLGR
ncbi:MAG: hypothetical protein KGO94_11020 [Alphaproteobacteria bacterium]|nr:hypothetical protein [Alphaproteobacteria bacterium]